MYLKLYKSVQTGPIAFSFQPLSSLESNTGQRSAADRQHRQQDDERDLPRSAEPLCPAPTPVSHPLWRSPIRAPPRPKAAITCLLTHAETITVQHREMHGNTKKIFNATI
jgi:hypothetical protein